MAERLLKAADGTVETVLTDQSRPEGTFFDEPWDHRHGFYTHPDGASIAVQLMHMKSIEDLMLDRLPPTAELPLQFYGGPG